MNEKTTSPKEAAMFHHDEVTALIGDPRIPDDRRVMYALMFMTGARFGEVAELRWRDYDPNGGPSGPLGRIYLAHDAAGRRSVRRGGRHVPVLPRLATMLDEWRRSGWRQAASGAPIDEDLVLPTADAKIRQPWQVRRHWKADLKTLGLDARRIHDIRRTFFALALASGVPWDALQQIGFGRSNAAAADHNPRPWDVLCSAMLLQVGQQHAGEKE